MNETETTSEQLDKTDRIGRRTTGACPDVGSQSSQSTAHWLTKAEAARALNSSEKHIDRLVERGRVQKALRKSEGIRSITIFHPGDIERERQKAAKVFEVAAFVEKSEGGERALTVTDNLDRASTASNFEGLAAALARIAGVAEALNERYAPNTAIYVSLEEALKITGLSADTIRGLARAGRIARLSRKYRRKDLELL
jgi:hypothetical protein